MLEKIFVLIAGLVVLITGGELLVRGASRIALRVHISPLVIGLTVVAFGTSAPELFISIQSALAGSPDMAMGNVIGSNICNIALVLGLTAVFSPTNVHKNSLRIDWPVAMGSSILLYLLVGNKLVWGEGLLMVGILISYIVFLIRNSRKERKAAMESTTDDLDLDTVRENDTIGWAKDALLLVLGCLGLYYGSDWFVGGAKDVFKDLGVADRVIGILVLALGTSLPELVTSIMAAIKKNTDLAIGNLIGSNIFNILSILGITSLIQSIEISQYMKDYDLIWMLGITFLLLPLMLINRRLGKVQGGILLTIYAYYTYTLIAAV